MKVWVVMTEAMYQDSTVLAVFGTEEAARNLIAECEEKAQNNSAAYGREFYLKEFELGTTTKPWWWDG